MPPRTPSNPAPLHPPRFKPAARRPARAPVGWDAPAAGDADADAAGFSAYMRAKKRKLRAQFSAQYPAERRASPSESTSESPSPSPSASASASASRAAHVESPVLRGVVLWVDGYTSPSRLRLRDLAGRHGGALETYFDADVVTHVVAETLAAATRIRLQKCVSAARVRVVTPAWVVDSVRHARRLPESRYPVTGMRQRAQKTIPDIFAPKAHPRANASRVSKVQPRTP